MVMAWDGVKRDADGVAQLGRVLARRLATETLWVMYVGSAGRVGVQVNFCWGKRKSR